VREPNVKPTNPIALPGFATEHPELHHYTSFAGLRGILSSNTLWATHFYHLNDSTEVMLLKQSVTKTLASCVSVPTNTPGNRHARRAATRLKNSDPATPELLRIFIDSAFEVAFKGFVHEATEKNIEALAAPFITSFCFRPPAQNYESINGLLSQWRAYGGRERYCIVLYCIVLYCIVLYCIVLYCIVLYCFFYRKAD
jgi:hypothetical protein